jgi:hypothetical protein
MKGPSMSLLIQKNGRNIVTVDQWFEFAPPKGGLRQWVDGRSAKELAKAFVKDGAPTIPAELGALLESNRELGPVDLVTLFPEYKIPLDPFRGETRNADLAAIGKARVGKIGVTIEAKADEAFGETIGDTLAKAARVSYKSNIPKRISALSEALFGQSCPDINDLRYQLLHGTAASLIFAREQNAVAAAFPESH